MTALCDWYRETFEQVGESVLDRAARYSSELGPIFDNDESSAIRGLRYEERLNSQDNNGRAGDSSAPRDR